MISVEELPGGTVYDIEVEGHQYIANGIVNHNTGRLASGKESKNKFFSPINTQSIPKSRSKMWYVREATEEEIRDKKDILGYYFSLTEKTDKMIEGTNPKGNVRKAFVPHNEDSLWVSLDMCLEAGSPVQTKRGYMGISELKPGDEILTKNGYAKVLRVKSTGKKRMCKVETDGQALYCSEDHPIIIDGEEVMAKDIKGVIKQVGFKGYCEEYENRESYRRMFEKVRAAKSSKEKVEAILKHGLQEKLEEAIGRYSRAYGAEICGVLPQSFYHIMKPLGLGGSSRPLKRENFWVCRNPFTECSPTSAYLYGYILGDGSICKRRDRYYLNISSADKEHLERIKDIFGGSAQVRKQERDGKEWWMLDIYDQSVMSSLRELGLRKNKSREGANLPVGWLGDNLRHALRGLIDADGSIRNRDGGLSVELWGHESYMKEIGDHYEVKLTKTGGLWKAIFTGERDSKESLYEHLYQGATIFLQRKRDTYEDWYTLKGDLPVWETWDITIDTEDHLYLTNGIETHNSAEELRIVANLYNEPTWIKAFLNGEDVHKSTAIQVFGEENYDREKRNMAKVVNFGKIYGMTASSLQEKFPHLTLDFCEQFMSDYVRALPYIFDGQDRDVRIARKKGTVSTVLGRPRRVEFYLKHSDGRKRGFGVRTVKNCFSLDTEVLTKSGWKYHYEIDEHTEIAYYDPFHNTYRYTEAGPTLWATSNTSIEFKGDNIDLSVTPNHRMFVCKESSEFGVEEAQTLTNKQFVIKTTADRSGSLSKIDTLWGKVSARHLAYIMLKFVSKGFIEDNKLKVDTFSWTREEKLGFQESIRELTQDLTDIEQIPESRRSSFLLENRDFNRWLQRQIKGESKGQLTPPSWINNLSTNDKAYLLQDLLQRDAFSREPTKQGFIRDQNRKYIDTLQQLMFDIGHTAVVSKEKGLYYRLNYKLNQEVSLVKSNQSFVKVTEEPRNFFCYNVPTGLMIVRRNGKISIQGNTQVQGLAGDVLRLMLVKSWKALKWYVELEDGHIVAKNPYGVRWRSTVHDEVNWSVPRDTIREVLPILINVMTVRIPSWQVPLTCGLEVGTSWGECFPFKYDLEKGTYIPDWEPVREEKEIEEEIDEFEETEEDFYWESEEDDW